MIGFGGGSAMDLAKLVAAMHGSGQALAEVIGAERVPARAPPGPGPTTAGIGSEAGIRALVTDPASRAKLGGAERPHAG